MGLIQNALLKLERWKQKPNRKLKPPSRDVDAMIQLEELQGGPDPEVPEITRLRRQALAILDALLLPQLALPTILSRKITPAVSKVVGILEECLHEMRVQLRLQPLEILHNSWMKDRTFMASGEAKPANVINLLNWLVCLLVEWQQRVTSPNGLHLIMQALPKFLQDVNRFRVESFLFWYYYKYEGILTLRAEDKPIHPPDPRLSESTDPARIKSYTSVCCALAFLAYIDRTEYIQAPLPGFVMLCLQRNRQEPLPLCMTSINLYRCSSSYKGLSREYALVHVESRHPEIRDHIGSWIKIERSSTKGGVIAHVLIAKTSEELATPDSIEIARISSLPLRGPCAFLLEDLSAGLAFLASVSGGFGFRRHSSRNFSRRFCRSLMMEAISKVQSSENHGCVQNAYVTEYRIRISSNRTDSSLTLVPVSQLEEFLKGDIWRYKSMDDCSDAYSPLHFIWQIKLATHFETTGREDVAAQIAKSAESCKIGSQWNVIQVLFLGIQSRLFQAEGIPFGLQEFKTVQQYLNASLDIDQGRTDTLFTPLAHLYMGMAYHKLGQLEAALEHYLISLKQYRSAMDARASRTQLPADKPIGNFTNPIVRVLDRVARLRIDEGDYVQALALTVSIVNELDRQPNGLFNEHCKWSANLHYIITISLAFIKTARYSKARHLLELYLSSIEESGIRLPGRGASWSSYKDAAKKLAELIVTQFPEDAIKAKVIYEYIGIVEESRSREEDENLKTPWYPILTLLLSLD